LLAAIRQLLRNRHIRRRFTKFANGAQPYSAPRDLEAEHKTAHPTSTFSRSLYIPNRPEGPVHRSPGKNKSAEGSRHLGIT
jgi:hypothetical protein